MIYFSSASFALPLVSLHTLKWKFNTRRPLMTVYIVHSCPTSVYPSNFVHQGLKQMTFHTTAIEKCNYSYFTSHKSPDHSLSCPGTPNCFLQRPLAEPYSCSNPYRTCSTSRSPLVVPATFPPHPPSRRQCSLWGDSNIKLNVILELSVWFNRKWKKKIREIDNQKGNAKKSKNNGWIWLTLNFH